jgi:predicted dehydrogenase
MESPTPNEQSRRDFLKRGSWATALGLLGGIELVAPPVAASATAAADAKERPRALGCAVVGLGRWGRQIVSTLSQLPQVDLVAVCDDYPATLRRGARLAPGAQQVEDARELLGDDRIQAWIIATPSHQHRELAEAALVAGRHVYCEAPLASSIAEAAAIARAAERAAPRWVFQAGLQGRSDPQRNLAATFFQSGVVGKPVMARAQWHRKQSWRQAAATPERQQAANWRLDASRSLGLLGEVAIHHLDNVNWMLGTRPVAITGQSSLLYWGGDGRTVPDTVHLLVEYPGGVRLQESCSLATSFAGELELVAGSDAAILFGEHRTWMFKELDAPLLGWEMHAREETVLDQTGLVLVANASKPEAREDGTDPIDAALSIPPLQHALESFVQSALDIERAVEDFVAAYGAGDAAALKDHLVGVPRRPGAGCREGFEAVVLAAKAQEAIASGRRLELLPEWFEWS